MKTLQKRLLWAIKRHPFLYLTLFKLISNNIDLDEINELNYNYHNPKEEIPQIFYDLNTQIFQNNVPADALAFTKKMCAWFNENIKGGPGLSLASEEAIRMMIAGKGGVCSDLAQVFNNFCVINNVKVREWGTTRKPFDKSDGGHSFNEIYSEQLEKWILIDTSFGIYFTDEQNNPCSAVEFFTGVRENKYPKVALLHNNMKIKSKAIEAIYFHKDVTPFIINNYSNKLYDRHLKKWSGKIPVFLIHFIIFMKGKSYRYQFPLDNYREIFG